MDEAFSPERRVTYELMTSWAESPWRYDQAMRCTSKATSTISYPAIRAWIDQTQSLVASRLLQQSSASFYFVFQRHNCEQSFFLLSVRLSVAPLRSASIRYRRRSPVTRLCRHSHARHAACQPAPGPDIPARPEARMSSARCSRRIPEDVGTWCAGPVGSRPAPASARPLP